MSCPSCNEIIISPRALSCGHTICLACVNSVLKKCTEHMLHTLPTCPLCEAKIVDINKNYAVIKLSKMIHNILNIHQRIIDAELCKQEKEYNELIQKHRTLKYQMDSLLHCKSNSRDFFLNGSVISL